MGHFSLKKPIKNRHHFFSAQIRQIFFFLAVFIKIFSTTYYYLCRYYIIMHGFHVLCFLEMVSHWPILKQVLAWLFNTLKLLLCWSVFIILHHLKNVPFLSIYVRHQIPVSSHFGNAGSKIHLCWKLFFCGFFLRLVIFLDLCILKG